MVLLIIALLALVASVYYSAENRTTRAYLAMRANGEAEFQVIDAFIRAAEAPTPEYYEALNLAAVQNDAYLDQVVTLYAEAKILLHRAAAQRILGLLPSESVKVNTAAGRIRATNAFGHEDAKQAIQLLEYSALRGDRDAAGYLSELYQREGCEVGAATWAKIANEREHIPVCGQIVVEPNRLSDEEWGYVVSNQAEIQRAWKRGKLPVVKYPVSCELYREVPLYNSGATAH